MHEKNFDKNTFKRFNFRLFSLNMCRAEEFISFINDLQKSLEEYSLNMCEAKEFIWFINDLQKSLEEYFFFRGNFSFTKLL